MSLEIPLPYVSSLFCAIKENPNLDMKEVNNICLSLDLTASQIDILARRVIDLIGLKYLKLFVNKIKDKNFRLKVCEAAILCKETQDVLLKGHAISEIENSEGMKHILSKQSFFSDNSNLCNEIISLSISVFPFPIIQSTFLNADIQVPSIKKREKDFNESIKKLYLFLENKILFTENDLAKISACMTRQALLVRDGHYIYAPTLLEEWIQSNCDAKEKVTCLFQILPFTFPTKEAYPIILRSTQKNCSFHSYVVNETLFCMEEKLKISIPGIFRDDLFDQMIKDDDLRRDISFFAGFSNLLIGLEINREKQSYFWLVRLKYYFAFFKEYYDFREKEILEKVLFYVLSAKNEHFEKNFKISTGKDDISDIEISKIFISTDNIKGIFVLIENLRPIFQKNGKFLEENAFVLLIIFLSIIRYDLKIEIRRIDNFIKNLIIINYHPLMIISPGQLISFFLLYYYKNKSSDKKFENTFGIYYSNEKLQPSFDDLKKFSFDTIISYYHSISGEFGKYLKKIEASSSKGKSSYGPADIDPSAQIIKGDIRFLQPCFSFFDVILGNYKYYNDDFSNKIRIFFANVLQGSIENVQLESFFLVMKNFLEDKFLENTFHLINYFQDSTKMILNINDKLEFLKRDLPKINFETDEDHLDFCLKQINSIAKYDFSPISKLNLFFVFVSLKTSFEKIRIKLNLIKDLEDFNGFALSSEKVFAILINDLPINDMAKILDLMKRYRSEIIGNVQEFFISENSYEMLEELNREFDRLIYKDDCESIENQILQWMKKTILSSCLLPSNVWSRFFPNGVIDIDRLYFQNPENQNVLCFLDKEQHYTKALMASWNVENNNQVFKISFVGLPEFFSFSLQTFLEISVGEIYNRPDFFQKLKNLAEIVCDDYQRPYSFNEIESFQDLITALPNSKTLINCEEFINLEDKIFDFIKHLKIQIRINWLNLVTRGECEKKNKYQILQKRPFEIVQKGNIFSFDYSLSLLPSFFSVTKMQKLFFTSEEFSYKMLFEILLNIRGKVENQIDGVLHFTLDESFQKSINFSFFIDVKNINSDLVSIKFISGNEDFQFSQTTIYPKSFIEPFLIQYFEQKKEPFLPHISGSFQEIIESQKKDDEICDTEEFILHPKKNPHIFSNLLCFQLLMLKSEFYKKYVPLRELKTLQQFDFLKKALKAKKKQKIQKPIFFKDEPDQKKILQSVKEDFNRISKNLRFVLRNDDLILNEIQKEQDVNEIFDLLMTKEIVKKNNETALRAMDFFHQGLFAPVQLEILQTLGIPDLLVSDFALKAFYSLPDYNTCFEMIISKDEITIKGSHNYYLQYTGEEKPELKLRENLCVFAVNVEAYIIKEKIISSWKII